MPHHSRMDDARTRAASAARLVRALKRSPSLGLLVAQATALLLYPFAVDSRAGHLFATLLSVGVLAMAVRMVRRSPRDAWLAGFFAVLGVVLWQVHASQGTAASGVAGALFYAAAYFYSAAAMIGYMLQDDRTTSDEMWAAAATFMLFVEGYAWLFMALQTVQPGALVIPGVDDEPMRKWMELVFISGTNFSNTGLSDIVPGTPHARMLVLLEQWNGLMYLALVVARLAGFLKQK
ncbi:ion channel [Thermomonas brevis]